MLQTDNSMTKQTIPPVETQPVPIRDIQYRVAESQLNQFIELLERFAESNSVASLSPREWCILYKLGVQLHHGCSNKCR